MEPEEQPIRYLRLMTPIEIRDAINALAQEREEFVQVALQFYRDLIVNEHGYDGGHCPPRFDTEVNNQNTTMGREMEILQEKYFKQKEAKPQKVIEELKKLDTLAKAKKYPNILERIKAKKIIREKHKAIIDRMIHPFYFYSADGTYTGPDEEDSPVGFTESM